MKDWSKGCIVSDIVEFLLSKRKTQLQPDKIAIASWLLSDGHALNLHSVDNAMKGSCLPRQHARCCKFTQLVTACRSVSTDRLAVVTHR